MRTFLAILVAAALLAACGESDTSGAKQGNGETARQTLAADGAATEPLSLAVTLVEKRSFVEPVVGTGTIAALKTSDVGPRVTGVIEEIFVRVGDRVEEGQPLFRTRPDTFKNRVAELKHEVDLSEAQLRQDKREYDRIRELHAKGVVSVGRLDEVEAKYQVTKARLGMSRSKLDQAQQNLDDTIVRSPFRGVITRRYKDEGVFMTTFGGFGDAGGPEGGGGGGRGVVQVMRIDIVAAIIQIPETKLHQIAVGTPGVVKIDGLASDYESEVHILNDRVDHITRTVEVRLALPNPNYEIKPGLFARAELYPEPRDVLALDRRAVLGTQAGHYVYIDDGGVARRTPVKTKELDATHVEILDGLAEGARVLVGPNLPRVRDGIPVSTEIAYVD